MQPVAVALIALAVAIVIMLGERALSLAHERRLRAGGAFEPPDDVYATMTWAYPGSFMVMALEGCFSDGVAGRTAVAGLAIFFAAKALKAWAIASLGERWTFRVLVPPSAPLVTRGPYTLIRHPNYVAIMGELAGFALVVGAPFTGIAAFVGFGALISRRIKVEERALGLRPD